MVFSVASGSLPSTSSPTSILSPTSSSTPTSSFRHRHSDIQRRRPHRGTSLLLQKSLRARKRPRRGRDKVQKNLRPRRRPRRGRDKVQKNLRARRRPRRGRNKVQKNPRARRNFIRAQSGLFLVRNKHFRRRYTPGDLSAQPSPTQQETTPRRSSRTRHRPRRLIEETREDEAAISFIKPDDSVLLVRLKGEV